jgi:hypothetical protein
MLFAVVIFAEIVADLKLEIGAGNGSLKRPGNHPPRHAG